MACFLVPVTEALVTTTIEKKLNKKEEFKPIVKKLHTLNTMLWGGSALLALEHVWHGEIVPWYPFLSAMNNQKDAAAMFDEMKTVGVSMALFVTGVWLVYLGASSLYHRRKVQEA